MPTQQGHPACPWYFRGTCAFNDAEPAGDIMGCPGPDPANPPTGLCPFSGAARSDVPPPAGTTARRMYDLREWEKANARCERERAEVDTLTAALDAAAAREVKHLTHEDASAGPRPSQQLMHVTLPGGRSRLWPLKWFRRGIGNV